MDKFYFRNQAVSQLLQMKYVVIITAGLIIAEMFGWIEVSINWVT